MEKDESYNNFYYVNKSKPAMGFVSACKECSKKYSLKYHYEHQEEHNAKHREYIDEHREEMNEVCRQWRKDNKPGKRKYFNDYMKRNKDKAAIYRATRQHKIHDITKDEWMECKNYFNNSCAYCGLKADDHFRIYAGKPQKIDLHKDHAINDGSNKVDNCIPCCLMCNSEKRILDYDVWYTSSNPRYSIDRYNRILAWLKGDRNEDS